MTIQLYTGVDTLESLTQADNYNRFLASRVTRHARRRETLVDFGAGIGTIAARVRNQGFEVVCVEPDVEMRGRLLADGFEAHARLYDLAPASVDLVFSLNVFEHIEDDQVAMTHVFSRLRPGGVFYFYVPAFEILMSSLDHKVGHFRRYTRKTAEQRLAETGFEICESRYVDCLGFPATLAYKCFGSRTGELNLSMVRVYDQLLFPVSRVLDRIFGSVAGKNLEIVARRPRQAAAAPLPAAASHESRKAA